MFSLNQKTTKNNTFFYIFIKKNAIFIKIWKLTYSNFDKQTRKLHVKRVVSPENASGLKLMIVFFII